MEIGPKNAYVAGRNSRFTPNRQCAQRRRIGPHKSPSTPKSARCTQCNEWLGARAFPGTDPTRTPYIIDSSCFNIVLPRTPKGWIFTLSYLCKSDSSIRLSRQPLWNNRARKLATRITLRTSGRSRQRLSVETPSTRMRSRPDCNRVRIPEHVREGSVGRAV